MIKLVKSTFYNEKETKQKLAEFIIRSQILSMGEETKKFEKSFAKKQERRFAVMTTSGSTANLLLLQALHNLKKLRPGFKVGVSSLTWATNIMPVMQLNMTPIALDCSISTLNVSPQILEKKISALDAFFLTNVLGFSDDIEKIKKLCDEKNIIFIEDNCESLGSRVGGKLLGNFGLASTFSFFVGHHLSTVEGGMITTDDEELYHALLLSRAHGWDRQLPIEKQTEIRAANNVNDFFAKYTFYESSYNFRPTEMQGFLGNNQLQYWDEIVSKRAENFSVFNDAIRANSDLIPLDAGQMDLVSNFAMPVIARNRNIFERYRKIFSNNNVEIRPVIAGNITRQPFYVAHVGEPENLDNSDFIHDNAFYFPNNPELLNSEVNFLIDLLK